ncbi:butyrophilin-like protein 1 [Melanotaenia boesemani]|uniref:butyrophilin-like protein 1 n=1 Tax=Melanotaenia boesemani TaxID=1250792 RepID=UPI001C04E45F|nr:butyrophilin-like protein 1 [Melanotaenia boesemani]
MKMLLVMVLLLHVSQHALPGVVEVNEGAESVLLPCELHGIPTKENLRVVWTRSDLSPRFVHQRGEEGDLEEQNQRYRGRTSMKPDALDSLDFSLTLRKPHLSDSSNYTCSITDGVNVRRVTDVELKVKGEQQTPAVDTGQRST